MILLLGSKRKTNYPDHFDVVCLQFNTRNKISRQAPSRGIPACVREKKYQSLYIARFFDIDIALFNYPAKLRCVICWGVSHPQELRPWPWTLLSEGKLSASQ